MKKFSLVLLLIVSVLVVEAQNQRVPNLRRNQPTTTSQTQSQTSAESLRHSTANVSVDVNGIIQQVIANSFLVIQQSYNIRRNGALVEGNDFFGHHFSVVPLLKYGYGIDALFNKPWQRDKRYAEYANCKECLVTVDRVQYARLSDQKNFVPFNLKNRITDTLTSGFYYVQESKYGNNGLGVQLGNGVRNGYLVWFTYNNGAVSFTVNPFTITFNENNVFNMPQPAMLSNVIGGFFIDFDVSDPGAINLNLLGVARLDSYGGGKWELVKMKNAPFDSGGNGYKKEVEFDMIEDPYMMDDFDMMDDSEVKKEPEKKKNPDMRKNSEVQKEHEVKREPEVQKEPEVKKDSDDDFFD